ncbi:hypothetical protein FA13DRAFT_1794590 [Coprinellus micaceus]|uniref:Uncharacterized protein n=1 Tax=Coprinellus micaceus TaxID=71717 RepID=A0A4Y7T0I3_COPMI|nr:hypothetical protein FA13DRAFT_1794590 [Coprinellus micaceus]
MSVSGKATGGCKRLLGTADDLPSMDAISSWPCPYGTKEDAGGERAGGDKRSRSHIRIPSPSVRHPSHAQEDTATLGDFGDDLHGAELSDSDSDGSTPMGVLTGKDRVEISHTGGEFGVLFEDSDSDASKERGEENPARSPEEHVEGFERQMLQLGDRP